MVMEFRPPTLFCGPPLRTAIIVLSVSTIHSSTLAQLCVCALGRAPFFGRTQSYVATQLVPFIFYFVLAPDLPKEGLTQYTRS